MKVDLRKIHFRDFVIGNTKEVRIEYNKKS
jgi:hypothetical protein